MTNKIKEITRLIELEKDLVLKLSHLRKLKQEIIKLETDFIKKLIQKEDNDEFICRSTTRQSTYRKRKKT